jgi:hypothetical protein
VERIQVTHPGPVTLMSHQMGLITYHVALKHFRSIRVLDLKGLVEPTFTNCEATRELAHKRTGIDLSMAQALDRPDGFLYSCGGPVPDVVFGFGRGEHMEALGYRVVIQASGDLPRRIGVNSEFVAVREDLAAELRLSEVQRPGVLSGTP